MNGYLNITRWRYLIINYPLTRRLNIIGRLKEPVLSKVCEKFGLTGKTVVIRRKVLCNYYKNIKKRARA